MNWVEYLQSNCQIKDPYNPREIKKSAEIAALTLQFEYGWKNFTVECTPRHLHLYYTTDSGLYGAMIPVEMIIRNPVIKPVLVKAIQGHEKNKSTYRK